MPIDVKSLLVYFILDLRFYTNTEEYHEKQYTGPGRRQDSQSEG
jgi:hypothetical protein